MNSFTLTLTINKAVLYSFFLISMKNSRTAVLETQSNSSMADNVGLVFGVKFLNTLTPISFEVECVAVDNQKVQERMEPRFDTLQSSTVPSSTSNGIGGGASRKFTPMEFSSNDEIDQELESITVGATASVVGLVSKAGIGVGRSDNDRQFIFCNGRPVDLPRVSKAMNEVSTN
jgi:DNA mismatch repair protein PMS2